MSIDEIEQYKKIDEVLADTVARLNSLYFVKHEQTFQSIPFKLQNYHEELLRCLYDGHKRQIVIKSHPVYFTTFMVVLMFDFCIHLPNFTCTIYNFTDEDIKQTIRDKVWYVAQKSPWVYENHVDIKKKLLARSVEFRNGSRIEVTRTGRSCPSNFNLITEAARTAENFPGKFRKSYRSMVIDSQYFINIMETSPYGNDNSVNTLIKESVAREKQGVLLKTDFSILFIPWWRDVRNVANSEEQAKIEIAPEFASYFDKVEKEEKTTLRPEQRAWYIKTLQVNNHNNWNQQKKVYPSTISESYINKNEMEHMHEKSQRLSLLEEDQPEKYKPDFDGVYIP